MIGEKIETRIIDMSCCHIKQDKDSHLLQLRAPWNVMIDRQDGR